VSKFVLYKRTGENSGPIYLIKTQLQLGEAMSRDYESIFQYEREVLAESDDLGMLEKMKRLAEGGEE
jgi:hypothetical protein